MITVIAEIKVKPGHRATVLQAIEKLVPLVLAEEGCGEYTPMVDSHTHAPGRNCRRTRCLCWKMAKPVASGKTPADRAYAQAPRDHQGLRAGYRDLRAGKRAVIPSEALCGLWRFCLKAGADVVEKTGEARRQLGVVVIHRVDRLTRVQRLPHQQRYQPARFPIASRHKVRQLDNARPRSANSRSVSPLEAEIVGSMAKCRACR